MKAAWVATNEEDGQSMKQNDEKQLSGGDVTLPFFLSLSLSISVSFLKNTQTHTYTDFNSFHQYELQSPFLKMC